MAILANIVLGYLLQSFAPWWTIIPLAAITACVFNLKGAGSFLAGFLGFFMLWAVYSYMLSDKNDHLLAIKMGEMFQNVGVPMIFVVSGLIGGIFGGLGSLLGYTLRKAFTKPNK
jgi:hypothetical protein